MTTMELLERGRMYYSAGDPTTAARYLEKVAEEAPTDRAVLTELALAHFRSAALGNAERVLIRLVELDPADAYARRLLGRTLARQGRHADALPHLRLASAMTGDQEVAAEVAHSAARLS